ncbi:hypothetical protein EV200_104473 [Pedobacter psychrotolerans]|uniref:Uncharacterized protein n=1 Tax=Pedobacter psychrotolerans TaxID=1843235 RepID=A0A4V6NN20_9SPHI|nr:hypothetical protein EV200_104473 [Pedobacter psychrotolerans]GGE45426.1 hypothetical protein GCM10011413_09510 [Pedobacter psychrotolerans]
MINIHKRNYDLKTLVFYCYDTNVIYRFYFIIKFTFICYIDQDPYQMRFKIKNSSNMSSTFAIQ